MASKLILAWGWVMQLTLKIRIDGHIKDYAHGHWIAKLRNNESCHMGEDLEQVKGLTWFEHRVPDYFKRLAQVQAIGSRYLLTCDLEVSKLGRTKIAPLPRSAVFSNQQCPSHSQLVLDPRVWFIDLATTTSNRFLLLSALPTDLFTSKGLIYALYSRLFHKTPRDCCHDGI